MDNIATVLGIIATIFTLLALAAGGYAFFRSSAADARIKRLQDERDDYLSRLSYIEPKFVELEQQNKLLKQLHNPTAQLESLHTKSDKMQETLDEQSETLHDIDRKLHTP